MSTGPVTIAASLAGLSNPDNYEGGVKILTTTKIKNRTTEFITKEFAGTVGVASLQVGTSGAPSNFTSIGTFTDRVHNSEVGDHPIVAGDTTDTTYTFSQGTATASDGKTAASLRLNSDTEIEESTDALIDSEVLDHVIQAMVDESNFASGMYRLSGSNPGDSASINGTWTSRGQIDDTQTDGTTVTKYLWQRTNIDSIDQSNADFDRTLLRFEDGNIREMTEAELRTFVGRFRNRIMANNIGKYVVDTAAPGTGTWQQKGETLTDQVKDSASYNYAGSYSDTYVGSYAGTYTGTYAGNYTGTYQLLYSGSSGGFFQGTYTGYYTGSYTGYYSGSYSGTYTGYYAGLTLLSSSSTQESKKLFVRIA